MREICQDKNGDLWIGTEDAGLNKISAATGAVTRFEPDGKPGSIAYSNIHGLLLDGDDLWIGTFEHGMDIMDINTGKVKKHYMAGPGPNDLKNNFIVSFLRTRSNDVYIGTAQGIYKYERHADNFVQVTEVAEGSFIPCMMEDRDGTIWVACHNRGLYYFNPNTGVNGHFEKVPGNKKSLSANSINSITEDSYGNIWLATEGGGLCKFDKKKWQFTRYSTSDGLPSNLIFKVLEDDKKTLWVTSSKGLSNFDVAKNKITVYTKADGILNDQFNYNSGYKDAQGNLYFGSVQGLIQFNPAQFHLNQFIPPIYITGLQVQNKEIETSQNSSILKKSIIYTSEITLPYDQSSFSIDFAALSFTSPETIEYSYQMYGLDKEWTNIQLNRKVYFTNLEPGNYKFKIKAGRNGKWNSNVKQLSIIITPPFWATKWAYLFYTIAFVAIAYYLAQSYHDYQENKKEKEIYQAKIDFFTNIAHEIKTPLTLIKGPVENLSEMVDDVPAIKDDVTTMERNTNRLINLINQILDFRQTETKGFSLDFAEVNMNELLEEAYLTFIPLAKKRKIDFTLNLPHFKVVMMADAEALTKIFHNLFSNAVKYSQREILVKMYPPGKSDTLVVEISNDGTVIPEEMREKIFEPFFRLRDTNRQKGTGLGLALVQSLVELHSGKVYMKDSVANRNVFVVELPYPNMQSQQKRTPATNETVA